MFTMRTTKPVANKYYITTSKNGWSRCIQGYPADTSCNVLANCVGYACGRFNEIYGELNGKDEMKFPYLNCNAENFIERAKNMYGLEISDKPTVGGIMVWQKGTTLRGNDGAGHVAVVEKIIDDNTIYTSESGYNSSAFWNTTRTNNNGRWGQGSAYKFIGCIKNPLVKETKKKLTKEELEQMVIDTLNGKYGNGEARKKALGEYWGQVQAVVDEYVKNKNKSITQTTETNIYVVKKGDTLSSIARKYGTTWKKLYELNKSLIDNDAKKHGVLARYGYYNFIYIGQKLKVK